jgi:hypothetical protein
MSATLFNFSNSHQSRMTDDLSFFLFVNCQLYRCQLFGGEYRSRTDDLLLAKQAL